MLMKGQKKLLIDDKNIIINFDIMHKNWEKIKAFGLAYEVIKIALHKCKKLNSEITIRLTDDKEMKLLNKKWRNIDSPTNVLAFPNTKKLNIDDDSKHIGDILISYNTIKSEAIERNINFIDHMMHIIIHGVLHLCGYDHIKKNDEKIMMNYEKFILNEIGIKDPYISYK